MVVWTAVMWGWAMVGQWVGGWADSKVGLKAPSQVATKAGRSVD